MNWLVLDYRDPALGLFFIVFLIFISSFLTYSFTIYKQRRTRKDINRFLKKFQTNRLNDNEYIKLYKTYKLPFDSILLLASTFAREGDYNKAINIYLNLLDIVQDKVKKEDILFNLGNVYFKSGFLQRAKETLLRLIKNNPHHKDGLKILVLIYEKLCDYVKALEVLEVLEEQGGVVVKDKLFVLTLKTINDPLVNIEIKKKEILKYFRLNRSIGRLVADFLFMYDKKTFWQEIDNFNKKQIIDILWNLEKKDVDFNKVKQDDFLKELFSAKGYIDIANKSDIFELSLLIALNHSPKKIDISLKFEYICNKCKNIMPISLNRCPKCSSILNINIKPIIAKKDETFMEGMV